MAIFSLYTPLQRELTQTAGKKRDENMYSKCKSRRQRGERLKARNVSSLFRAVVVAMKEYGGANS